MVRSLHLKIAGITFSLKSEIPIHSPGKAYEMFLSKEEGEVFLHIFQGNPVGSLRKLEPVFESGTNWNLWRSRGRWVFVLRLPDTEESPLLALFEPDFRRGEIYLPTLPPAHEGLLNILAYPLGQFLMICLLARERGVMFHACGIDDKGLGYLFLGNSTHGKSTIAQLWEDQCTVLNDDRVVVRERDGEFWMYGTPWHGTYTQVSPRGVPIDSIFFLRHGRENSAVPKRGMEALSMMLQRSFPPIWDKVGMSFTVNLCQRMAERILSYELRFVPNRAVVDFARNLAGRPR